jgi:hypothetical protein
LELFDDLVEEVFSLDPNVRYVAVLDSFGQHLSGGMREGKTSINPMEEEEKLFSQTIISRGMSETWRRYFGAPRYLVVAHERLLVFQFPYAENVLLVTAEPFASLDLVKKIEASVVKYKGVTQQS